MPETVSVRCRADAWDFLSIGLFVALIHKCMDATKKKTLLTAFVLLALLVTVVVIKTIRYPHPGAYEIEWNTYIQQPDDITCGPTSVAMVLNHYGKSVDVDDVKPQTKTEWVRWGTRPIGMTSPEMIPRALSHFGVPAFGAQADFDQLRYYVSNDLPCIVLVRSGLYTFHYVVVIGYTEDSVVIADPGCTEKVIMDARAFRGAWSFDTDMEGNRTTVQCKICNGRGHYLLDLGPLTKCEICDGTGDVSGVLQGVLWAAEVYPCTMIVPRIHTSNADRR